MKPRRCLRQCLQAKRRVLGPDHPYTLRSTWLLGQMLQARGLLDEAEKMLRSCLEAQRRTLGPNHPDTRQTEKQLSELVAARPAKK